MVGKIAYFSCHVAWFPAVRTIRKFHVRRRAALDRRFSVIVVAPPAGPRRTVVRRFLAGWG